MTDVDPPTSGAAPAWIGRYQVGEVLGTGAFATVYRATDEHLDVDVAVKVLAENHSLDPDVRQRFIEEGRRLRRLRSPHVISVHDLGDTERAQPYLVLDCADRGDLAGRVAKARRRGWYPTAGDILAVARPVAAALRELHRHRLVHRDLAPTNLLLASTGPPALGGPAETDPRPAAPSGSGTAIGEPPLLADDEQLMLSDLGLSKDLAAASGLTMAAGTSGFAPPEQRRSGGTVDRRADVWAATALVVWLILDHPPDDADASWVGDVRSLGRPDIGALVPMLERGLAGQPDKRYPDIDRWLTALEEALGATATSASAGTAPSARPGPAAAARRRVGPAATAVAALLAGGFIGATLLPTGEPGKPATRTERIDGGDLRTVVEEHGITIDLTGPTDTSVGEPVRLSAEVTGTETWQWVGPDGVVHPNRSTIELSPEEPGRGTARLLAVDDHGRVVEATHTLRVSD